MGAKKGKKGKKGSKKKGGGDLEANVSEKNWQLQAEIEALTQKLINEQGMADRGKAQENEKRHKEIQLNKILRDQKKRTMDIVADMTRQFKSKHEELSQRIADLSDLSAKNQDKIQELEGDYQRLQFEKNDIENQKNEEIKDLKKRIDEMSNEFAEMLKETLNKMQEKIDLANKQWEEENNPNMLRRFEDLALGNKQA